MTVFELLSAYRPMLNALATNGYPTHNIRDVELYLQIYEEYKNLLAEKYKKEYIYATLCEKHKVGRTTIFRILKKMKKRAKV